MTRPSRSALESDLICYPVSHLLARGWPLVEFFQRLHRNLIGSSAQLQRLCSQTESATGPLPRSIDLVVTWVDGADPQRRALKQRYSGRTELSRDANIPCRDRDNDELRYLLRSAARFASWLNRIFVVVSDHQRPNWSTDNPDLVFVNDTEILPGSCLPTFNSHALEANIHRIPGLSEHYIYCCDDMMFARNLKPGDFVDPQNGALKLPFQNGFSPSGGVDPEVDTHNNAWRNTNALLDRQFGHQRRPAPAHLPTILSRSVAEQAWALFPEELQQTSARRFRSLEDVHPIGLQQYLSVYNQRARAVPSRNDVIRLENWRGLILAQFQNLKLRPPKMFCVNDGHRSPDSRVFDDLAEFLNDYFPQPSPFEL